MKQDSIISPILCVCVYLDGLSCNLQAAGIGCRIGNLFTDVVLTYADDIILLAPTVRAMRSMIKPCDDCAKAFLNHF